MAGHIPDDLIQTVQEQNDIVEVISEHLQLKKSGRSFKALCPFHSEKTPSFYVNPDKQIFHCFGCGVGGNVFSFLMKHNQMNFGEAVRQLAEKKGIGLPKNFSVSRQTSDLARNILKANETAARYFEHSLKQTREGQIALAYLEKRQIKSGTVEKMRLGYAPLKGDGLCSLAKEGKIPLSLLEKAGLVSPRRAEEGYYDYFRKRIIFPIFNVVGKVIGFGGRVLDDTQPKYLNSPETPVFSKSAVLYGLNFAKESIQKTGQALVVEGYLDFITLAQAGIKNVAASSGTALTEGQVRLLKRFAREVVLVYDPDAAGQAATLRGIELLLRHRFQVKIVALRDGLDPDGFVRKAGKDAFLSAVNDALGFFEYNLERLMKLHNPSVIQGKVAIVEAILPWVKLVDNSIQRREMLRQIAERLAVEEGDVTEEFNRLSQRRSLPEEPRTVLPSYSLDAEGSLIKLILDNASLLDEVKKQISPQEFSNDSVRQIAEIIWNYGAENKLPSSQSLINSLPGEKIREAFTFFVLNKTVFQDEAKAIRDCIGHIRKRKKIRRQKELEREIKLAEAKGEDISIVKKLLTEYQDLVKAS
ncbi:MAG: DNA primase [Candidatus Ratteibacteria bacterium]|nr:DNA primase [Candidatus Ratteibacteria bacterium]